jgi:hypothetical protein
MILLDLRVFIMQGQHHYQPELFSQIDYENLIPQNHLLRKIDRVLDLSFLREMTSSFYSSDNGRPSIDPEVFVRMVLLEFERWIIAAAGASQLHDWEPLYKLKIF